MSKSNKPSDVAGAKNAGMRTAIQSSKGGNDGQKNAVESILDPLSLWRTLCAPQFTASNVLSMQHAVAKVVPFGVKQWPFADVAAAVGAAIDFLPLKELTAPFDLCMTVLGLHAIEGNAAAAIVLSNIVRNLPDRTGSHRRIATSWFVANLVSAAALNRDAAKLPSGCAAPARNTEESA